MKQDHLRMNNSIGSNNHLRDGFLRKKCCSFDFTNYLPPPPSPNLDNLYNFLAVQDSSIGDLVSH